MARFSPEVQNICPQGIWAEHKGPEPCTHSGTCIHGSSSHTPIRL